MKKFAFLFVSLLLCSCTKQIQYVTFVAPDFFQENSQKNEVDLETEKFKKIYDSMSPRFKASFRSGNTREFLADLNEVLASDTDNLLMLCDKTHFLPDGYEPNDLVLLSNNDSYNVSRGNLYLRSPAEKSLREMGEAARKSGLTLLVSSTYRSYDYQVVVYNRIVAQDGQAEADRVSARPGTSQHQTGAVIDFGSIDDSFEDTKPGKWLLANAARFGWSLSFPPDMEDVTGYKYECWHYRFLGKKPCEFQEKWFGGVQQFMLEFIDAWRNA